MFIYVFSCYDLCSMNQSLKVKSPIDRLTKNERKIYSLVVLKLPFYLLNKIPMGRLEMATGMQVSTKKFKPVHKKADFRSPLL